MKHTATLAALTAKWTYHIRGSVSPHDTPPELFVLYYTTTADGYVLFCKRLQHVSPVRRVALESATNQDLDHTTGLAGFAAPCLRHPAFPFHGVRGAAPEGGSATSFTSARSEVWSLNE